MKISSPIFYKYYFLVGQKRKPARMNWLFTPYIYMGENNQLFTSIFNVTKPHITHLIRGPGTVNVYDPERALKDLNLSKK